MEVSGASSSSSGVISPDQAGFGALTADKFMTLLITQLQNQDPTEPVGNEELLNQLSMMRNLQSNIELGDALKSITVDQRLATSASFIGKEVVGVDVEQKSVTGVVDRAFVRDGEAYVGIGEHVVPLDSITDIGIAA